MHAFIHDSQPMDTVIVHACAAVKSLQGRLACVHLEVAHPVDNEAVESPLDCNIDNLHTALHDTCHTNSALFLALLALIGSFICSRIQSCIQHMSSGEVRYVHPWSTYCMGSCFGSQQSSNDVSGSGLNYLQLQLYCSNPSKVSTFKLASMPVKSNAACH